MSYNTFKQLKDVPENFYKGSVLVEEKLNAFPITFYSHDGELHFETPKGAPASVVDYIRSIEERIKPGWTYHAGAPFGYSHRPQNELVLFDVERDHPQDFLNWSEKRMVAASLGVDTPQVIYEGKPLRHEGYMPFLEIHSALGGGEVSGIVVKNYGEFDKDGKVLMASLENKA